MTDEATAAESTQANEAELVPRAALEDERHKRQDEQRQRQGLQTELAELRGQVNGLSQASQRQPPPQEKVFNAAELRRAVDDGRMTEDESEQIKERQIETRVAAKIETRLRQELSNQTTSDRLVGEIQRYVDAIPELSDRESAQHAKLKREFDHLVGLGYDRDDRRTDVAAARAAFGDPAKIRDIKADPPGSHQETGGSAAGALVGATRSDGWPKDMPPRHREFYENQIRSGQVPDKKAAIAAFNYQPKHSRAYQRPAA